MRYVKCAVCGGAGWWDRATGRIVVGIIDPADGLQRCFYCDGVGMARVTHSG